MLQRLQTGKMSLKGWLDVHISFCTTSVTLHRAYVNLKYTDNLIVISGSFIKTSSGARIREIPDSKQQIDLKGKEKKVVLLQAHRN